MSLVFPSDSTRGQLRLGAHCRAGRAHAHRYQRKVISETEYDVMVNMLRRAAQMRMFQPPESLEPLPSAHPAAAAAPPPKPKARSTPLEYLRRVSFRRSTSPSTPDTDKAAPAPARSASQSAPEAAAGAATVEGRLEAAPRESAVARAASGDGRAGGATRIDDLPDELLCLVFLLLGPQVFRTLGAVCRRWYTLSTTDALWRTCYSRELAKKLHLTNFRSASPTGCSLSTFFRSSSPPTFHSSSIVFLVWRLSVIAAADWVG